MTLGIMQPYFLPYLGYFSLIKHTDEFILFDPVQFIRHGWIERNRTLKQGEGWQYIQVPLIKSSGRNTLIKDVTINNATDWKQKIFAQIQHYKKIAPYYKETVNLLMDAFSSNSSDITHLNKNILSVICSYLGINRIFPIYSEMNLAIEPVSAPDEWALQICKAMKADTYINPIGGMEFFDRSKYAKAGISLYFQQMELLEYSQGKRPFEPGLSIVDVLMFNSVEETHKLLEAYTLI